MDIEFLTKKKKKEFITVFFFYIYQINGINFFLNNINKYLKNNH